MADNSLKDCIRMEFSELPEDLQDKIEAVVDSCYRLAYAVNRRGELKKEKIKAIVGSMRSLVNVLLLE